MSLNFAYTDHFLVSNELTKLAFPKEEMHSVD
jgi:hypothetical protein